MTTSQLAPARSFFDVAVLNQSGGLFGRAGAQIHGKQRCGSSHSGPCQIFIGAKLIAIDRVPGLVQHMRTVRSRANAIEPVVARHEVAAGIANDGNSDVLYFLDHILAESITVRKLGGRIVNSLVNRSAELLEEGAKHIAIEGGDRSL